ncbi:MAG: hypothetical protein WC833_08605 [Bacteroidales bacterium]|jgi:hypothetical protein
MKKFIKNIWTKVVQFIKKIYTEVDKLADKYCPVAIDVVEFIKTINENTTGDIIELLVTKVIPGTADDVAAAALRVKLKSILPKVLTTLQISNSIAQEKDVNKQLIAICSAINMSSDETKNTYYHAFSTLVLQFLSDGKLTWSESVQLAEFWYKNVYKK